MTRRPKSFGRPAAQRGVALIVVLLLLLLVTLLGLAAMRGSLLQERMSGNLRSRGLAFQMAEATLRVGESYAAGSPLMPDKGTDADPAVCSAGLCGMPYAGDASPWEAADFWNTATNYRSPTSSEVSRNSGDVVGYVVEDLGIVEMTDDAEVTTSVDQSAPPMNVSAQFYRIVAHVRLANGAQVTLQSRYRVK